MSASSINIFQKNWAFTSANSEKKQIKTGSFGPCYVVSFTSGKFAALAHIDDTTKVDSITAIFERFLEDSIHLQDVKVVVLGGWRESQESFKWGTKIVQKIHEAGFENVSTKNMYLKKTATVEQCILGISPADIHKYYHLGALVDATNGRTYLVHEYSPELEEEQRRQSLLFAQQYACDVTIEVPLTQITE